MGVKKESGIRIGTTSYVLPADMLTNVRHLAGRVDDIELLVFESDTMAELPDPGVVRELSSIARASSLTYTVHLPLDIRLGAENEALRERSVGKCTRTIERMAAVDPVAYILHCDRQSPDDKALPDARWVATIGRSLCAFLATGVDPQSVCVETLDGSFPLLEPIIRANGLSVCLDIGHQLLCGLDIDDYLNRYGDLTRVIHLHGVVDGKDHRDITGIPGPVLERVLGAADRDGRCRVVTIEVFNESDLAASLGVMERLAVCRT